MMREVLLREGMLLCDKSSRLLHQKSQLKKWRVIEMKRIIRRDMRLYTIGKISDEIVFSFSIDRISIIFFIDCIHIFLKQKKQVATALYSFLFNKDVIFITFSSKTFSLY